MSRGDYIIRADLFSRKLAELINQIGLSNGGTSTNSGDAYTLTLDPPISRLTDGMAVQWTSNFTNTTTTPTLAFTGTIENRTVTVAAVTILRGDGSAIVAGDIVSGTDYIVIHDSSANKWRLLGVGIAATVGALVAATINTGNGAVELYPSGAYTPSLTRVANLDAVGTLAYDANYFRVGNIVTVSGVLEVNPTAGATLTQLGLSLPIASAIPAGGLTLAGTANSIAIVSESAGIKGDGTNDRAQIEWITTTTTQNQMSYVYSYLVQ